MRIPSRAPGYTLRLYEAKECRAQADQDMALDNNSLSEEEVAEKVGAAQRTREIYTARTANKQVAVTKLLGELETAIKAAQVELSVLVGEELGKRRQIISERVLAVLKPTGAPGQHLFLNDMLDYSAPILDIAALSPAPFTSFNGNEEYLLETAKETLSRYKRL